MATQRSKRHVLTAKHSTELGARSIDAVRAAVRAVNDQLREEGNEDRFRVVLSARKGSDPHAWKYENRFLKGKRRRFEDNEKVDVYVVPKGAVRRDQPRRRPARPDQA
jgi:hypothetical protein